MRTTLDLPDELYCLAKAEAALQGRKLKDLLAQALRQALGASEAKTAARAALAPSTI